MSINRNRVDDPTVRALKPGSTGAGLGASILPPGTSRPWRRGFVRDGVFVLVIACACVTANAGVPPPPPDSGYVGTAVYLGSRHADPNTRISPNGVSTAEEAYDYLDSSSGIVFAGLANAAAGGGTEPSAIASLSLTNPTGSPVQSCALANASMPYYIAVDGYDSYVSFDIKYNFSLTTRGSATLKVVRNLVGGGFDTSYLVGGELVDGWFAPVNGPRRYVGGQVEETGTYRWAAPANTWFYLTVGAYAELQWTQEAQAAMDPFVSIAADQPVGVPGGTTLYTTRGVGPTGDPTPIFPRRGSALGYQPGSPIWTENWDDSANGWWYYTGDPVPMQHHATGGVGDSGFVSAVMSALVGPTQYTPLFAPLSVNPGGVDLEGNPIVKLSIKALSPVDLGGGQLYMCIDDGEGIAFFDEPFQIGTGDWVETTIDVSDLSKWVKWAIPAGGDLQHMLRYNRWISFYIVNDADINQPLPQPTGVLGFDSFSVSPIPEPATLSLLALGGLALLRRRSGQVLRRRKSA